MKYFAVLLVIAFAAAAQALTDEQKKLVKEHHKVCKEESGVAPEMIAELRKGVFTEDAKLKAFVRCFFVRAQFMNAEGVVQPDIIKAKSIIAGVDQKEADNVITVCKGKKGVDIDDTAFLIYKCYWETAKVHLTLLGPAA